MQISGLGRFSLPAKVHSLRMKRQLFANVLFEKKGPGISPLRQSPKEKRKKKEKT